MIGIPFPQIDPILIEIGPLAIRWYALSYIVGLLIGWRYIIQVAETHRLWPGGQPVTRDQVDDILLWVALGVILGGRLGYVLFYDPLKYLSDPLTILQVWNGGMSFHGGFLGVVAAIILFSKREKLAMWSVGDLLAGAAPIGLFFGRIANFINAELWGRTTNMPWGIIFPNGGPFARHPSQLYEALLEGVILFIVIRYLSHKTNILRHPGGLVGVFIMGYGLARIIVEFFREPDQHIGYLAGFITMGMVLSLPMVIIGGLILRWALDKPAIKAKPVNQKKTAKKSS